MVALVGLVVWMTASVSGCSAAALAYTGHKISEAQKESAAQHNEAMSEMAYSNYCYQMENLNLKREKEGLKPRPIMSKQEWLARCMSLREMEAVIAQAGRELLANVLRPLTLPSGQVLAWEAPEAK
jgi:hypothetical protein